MKSIRALWGIKHVRTFIALFSRYDQVVEQLAANQHDIWAHWMKYLFSKCVANDDGSMTIPADLVERWQRQMQTPYAGLPVEEQQSDKRQAKKVLKSINLDIN